MIKTLFIFGTRPEAIKLAPAIRCLQARRSEFDVRVCVTAQHRQMLDEVLAVFDLTPDHDLDVMLPGQTLYQSTSRIIAGLEPVIAAERPDFVIVQGDTTTTFCGALAAFYAGVPVAHVEAGLRTGDLRHPFPEEMNRILTSRLATIHFPPTEQAAANLLAEGVAPEAIHVTGNTAIDAVLHVRDKLAAGHLSETAEIKLDPAKRLLLVTAHRRESFGEGFERICSALARLAEREDVELVYPVHPNPNVREPVYRRLGGSANIHLTEPLAYVPFIDLMRRAYLLLTDSGGIQEEAPSLGKPVLVMRRTTERPEAVEAGTSILVGADSDVIVSETARLLDDEAAYTAMSRIHNPYGDGAASQAIATVLAGAM